MVKIGLEIHVEITENIKTKIFCGCLNKGSDIPNTRTCPICLGMPGAKPVLNKKILEAGLKVALALNCKISEEMFFSRKTYFYPDLPNSYQITQYETPLGVNGEFNSIKIRRVHIEEDPGKLIHEDNYVLIDYNRNGVPLVEIVTEPEFNNHEEVRLFLQNLLTMLEYLSVYDRKSESSLRVDVNVSSTGERVEIKNIGSVKDVEKALKHEIERQKKDTPKFMETRGWDNVKESSKLLRSKESEEDYGYIFEPNLTRIRIDDEEVEKARKNLPELQDKKTLRFVKKYDLKLEDAKVLTSDLRLADFFEKVACEIDYKLAGRWFVGEILKVLNYNKMSLSEWDISEKEIIEILKLLEEGKITESTAKKTLEKLSLEKFSPTEYIEKNNLFVVSSDNYLSKICDKVIKENKKAVEDYKNGEEKSFNFLVGKVMKETRGTGNVEVVRKLLKGKLK